LLSGGTFNATATAINPPGVPPLKVLVTGAAGFIGMHVSQLLLARGDEVVGLDNLNAYYDPQLKLDRLARLTDKPGFRFVKLDVADRAGMEALFVAEKFDRVVHLAAQAGVAGVYLNLASGATLGRVSSGNTTTGFGDVNITAVGDLVTDRRARPPETSRKRSSRPHRRCSQRSARRPVSPVAPPTPPPGEAAGRGRSR